MSNHLKVEQSRYLKQHANNPVDWYAWSEEPFRKAAAEDKPLFVSIGYSSCHWCHVMARECFEDEEVARLLNEQFVSIKVDREEHPDVDSFYMEFLSRLTGRGGWPLNVFVNPNRAPFYAVSYVPKEQLVSLLPYIAAEYQKKEELQTQTIDGIFAVGHIDKDKVRGMVSAAEPPAVDHSRGPQFPQGAYLSYLLARGKGDAVRAELDNLICKGLFDHIEGGWFRYSVDPDFRIPHFEKMLYDQAALLYLCAEAYHLDESRCGYAIEKTASWLADHMRLSNGLYGSATDADTAQGEGYYYTEEHTDDPETARLFRTAECGVHEGRYLPWIDLDYVRSAEGKAREIIAEHARRRASRTAPALDGKAVISWNCFLGYSLARCAAASESVQIAQMALDLYRSVSRFVSERVPHVVYDESILSSSEYLEDYASYLLFNSVLGSVDGRQDAERVLARVKDCFFRLEYLFHTTDPVFENLSLWQDTPVPSGGAMLLHALLNLNRSNLEGLDTLGIAEVATKNPTYFGMWCSGLERAYSRNEPSRN